MTNLTLSLTNAASSLFAALRERTGDGVGISRDSYGSGETAAVDVFSHFARGEGLHTECDAGGNLIVCADPESASRKSIVIGSHLDSVPQGGNFDGAAGIVAGLLCLIRFREERVPPPCPIKVLGLRGEESAWFGKAHIGANALFGTLSPADLLLRKRESSITLRECMAGVGADVDGIAASRPLLDPSSVASYLELHIEQGAVMVSRGFATAVVPAIRGNVRHNRIRCVGEAAHSGATPRWLRRDAVFAVADLLMRVADQWRELLERGLHLVVTAGIISTHPDEHAVSRVPGEATFSLEIRSQSQDTLEAFHRLIQTECRVVEDARKVKFLFDRRIDSAPARMNERIVATLLECSRWLGLPAELVPSGPGHDASLFANNGIPSGMLFVRNDGGSHNPRESMALEDFMAGVELLFHACKEPRWLF